MDLASVDLKFKLMGVFFDKVIQLNPKSAMGWNNKGIALSRLGMHEDLCKLKLNEKAAESKMR